MDRLHPTPARDVDPLDVYGVERPAPDDRPWVLLDMVASIDGATAVDGRSGALGGAGDHRVFHALRALADVILVGAGTVRAERYGPPRVPPALQEQRVRRGQTAQPTIAVVSRRLDLDPSAGLFEGEVIVVATPDSPADARDALGRVAEVLVVDDRGRADAPVDRASVDLRAALAVLAGRGVGLVVCEGGPILNAQLSEQGLVDEICLTVAPVLAGGSSSRLLTGAALDDGRFALAHVLVEDDELFLRYVRR